MMSAIAAGRKERKSRSGAGFQREESVVRKGLRSVKDARSRSTLMAAKAK